MILTRVYDLRQQLYAFHAHSTHRATKNATAKGLSLRGDRRLFDQVVRPLPVFQHMPVEERQELIKVIDAKSFKQDEFIYKKGEVAIKKI